MLPMKLFPPVKLEITAEKLSDDKWRLLYKEWCPLDQPEAFQNTVKAVTTIASNIQDLGIQVDEKQKLVTIHYTATQENVFNLLTGEFIGLSGIGQMLLRDFIIKGGLGTLALSYLKEMKEVSEDVEVQ